MPDESTPSPARQDRALLHRIAGRLANPEFGTGALASLRRGDPSTVRDAPSFHRLVRDVPDSDLDADGAIRWATAVHVLALAARPGSGTKASDVGAALADAGFSESRLGRLLASRGAAFRDQAALAARLLHARDAACTPTELAELALVEERAERRAERLRFRIARGYYRAHDTAARTT